MGNFLEGHSLKVYSTHNDSDMVRRVTQPVNIAERREDRHLRPRARDAECRRVVYKDGAGRQQQHCHGDGVCFRGLCRRRLGLAHPPGSVGGTSRQWIKLSKVPRLLC